MIADVQRVNNELIVTVGESKVVLGAVNPDGSRKNLSSSGALELKSGESISVRVEGLTAGAPSEFWLFSNPILLGEVSAGDSGRLAAETAIPDDAAPGNHRFVLVSTNSDGEPLTLSAGIVVQPDGDGGIRWEIVLSLLVLGGGGLVALFLPAVLRRRAA